MRSNYYSNLKYLTQTFSIFLLEHLAYLDVRIFSAADPLLEVEKNKCQYSLISNGGGGGCA